MGRGGYRRGGGHPCTSASSCTRHLLLLSRRTAEVATRCAVSDSIGDLETTRDPDLNSTLTYAPRGSPDHASHSFRSLPTRSHVGTAESCFPGLRRASEHRPWISFIRSQERGILTTFLLPSPPRSLSVLAFPRVVLPDPIFAVTYLLQSDDVVLSLQRLTEASLR